MKLLNLRFATALLIEPNGSLKTSFSDTHSLFSSSHMKDQVSHHTKEQAKLLSFVCHILLLLANSNQDDKIFWIERRIALFDKK